MTTCIQLQGIIRYKLARCWENMHQNLIWTLCERSPVWSRHVNIWQIMLLADSVKTMLFSDIISVFIIITCNSILFMCVCSCWQMEYQLNFEKKTLEVPECNWFFMGNILAEILISWKNINLNKQKYGILFLLLAQMFSTYFNFNVWKNSSFQENFRWISVQYL